MSNNIRNAICDFLDYFEYMDDILCFFLKEEVNVYVAKY